MPRRSRVAFVSDPGGPEFESFEWAGITYEWRDATESRKVGYYRDPHGIVRLSGALCRHEVDGLGGCEAGSIGIGQTPVVFTLPPGYDPGFERHLAGSVSGEDTLKDIRISEGVVYINPNLPPGGGGVLGRHLVSVPALGV